MNTDIDELEHEIRLVRARNERLEDTLRVICASLRSISSWAGEHNQPDIKKCAELAITCAEVK